MIKVDIFLETTCNCDFNRILSRTTSSNRKSIPDSF